MLELDDMVEGLVGVLQETVREEFKREYFYVRLLGVLGSDGVYLDYYREHDPAISGAFQTVRALAGRTYGLERKV